MPQGFELVSVTRMRENTLGEALHVVPVVDFTYRAPASSASTSTVPSSASAP